MDSLEDYPIPARDVTVWQDHKEIYRYSCGHSDFKKEKPVSKNDVYLLYSATKISTAVAALRLIERGKLALNDAVSKYLPEYAGVKVRDSDSVRDAKTVMTVEDLLTMRGGFSYDLNSPHLAEMKKNKDASTRDFISALSHEPLMFDPGEHFNYSLCHDVLGAVIEVAADKPFGEFLKDEIFSPLCMTDTTFHPTKEQLSRRTQPYDLIKETATLVPLPEGSGFIFGKNYESGGAGLYSTVDDYIKLGDALSCGGVAANGYRVLNAETVDMMRKNRLNSVQLNDFHTKNKHVGFGYGLGVAVLMDKRPAHFSCSEGIFTWGGAAGVRMFMDRERALTVLYAQEVLRSDYDYETRPYNVVINTVYNCMDIK